MAAVSLGAGGFTLFRRVTLPVRMFLYIQDNIDPLVTSVSACVIAITMTALILLDRFYGLDRVLAGKGDPGR